MAGSNHRSRMYARDAYQAWEIAWRTAEAYQRKMNTISKKRNAPRWHACKIGRDVASRIAAKIKYGRSPRK